VKSTLLCKVEELILKDSDRVMKIRSYKKTFCAYLACLVSMLLVPAGQADAFVLQKAGKWYEQWPGSAIPISYKINTSGMPAGAELAIRNAFQSWNDVGTASLSFVYAGTTSLSAMANDGENIVRWVTDIGYWRTEYGTAGDPDGKKVASHTKVYANGTTGFIEGADIEFNGTAEFIASYPWSTTGEAGKLDIQNMATHEVGHFIGIDHICDPDWPDDCQDPGGLTCRQCSTSSPDHRLFTMYPQMALGETEK